ncbi:hypothetical protein GUITHDRAFT_138440 [Guillardia theta CCMP2712]|uniref:PDZ domain-containing protein n=1 Tax=Guillardia theta (strain CCMP2712) TaxID=905079 RepID=L1JE16_GUITC|nr:hypothetical protein GUITHDRAFT_138440 [Guillardia theta CCMP2712]EKX46369.1 hypothetical protein GUITHDRAFT_138440 [Guillardia theta CCMP2712]|eukprot:XP_005833349.1 hypothetical protein GUITHDRAFT_138440 [Guillardia theta CCMP2712]
MASVLLANSGAWLVALVFGLVLFALVLLVVVYYCKARALTTHASITQTEHAAEARGELMKEGFLYVEGLQGKMETRCLIQVETDRIWIRHDTNSVPHNEILEKPNVRVKNGNGCEFLLVCGETKYILRAQSIEEKTEWMIALQRNYQFAETDSISSQESVFLPPPYSRRQFTHQKSPELTPVQLGVNSLLVGNKSATIKRVAVVRNFNVDGMMTHHHLAGIGIKFTYLPSRKLYEIVDVDRRGPASVGGKLRTGDVLFSVDDKLIKEKLPHEITALIVGQRGSIVVLGVSRQPPVEIDVWEQELRSKAGRVYDKGVELLHAHHYQEATTEFRRAEEIWENDCDNSLAASVAYRHRVSAMRKTSEQRDEVKEAYEQVLLPIIMLGIQTNEMIRVSCRRDSECRGTIPSANLHPKFLLQMKLRSPSLPPLKPVTVLSQTPTGVKVTTKGFATSSPQVQHQGDNRLDEHEIERTQSGEWGTFSSKQPYAMKAAEGGFYGSQSLSLADTLDQQVAKRGQGQQASLPHHARPLASGVEEAYSPYTEESFHRSYSHRTSFQGPKLSILSIKTLSGNRELREQIYSKLHEKSKGELHNTETLSEQVDEYLREQTGRRHEGEEDELAFMIREKDMQDYNQTGVSWKKLDEAALRGRKEMFAHGFVRAMKNRYDAAGEEVSECVWCGKTFKSLRQRRIHDLKCKKRSESKTASRVVSPSLLRLGSKKKLLPNVDETLFTKKKISEACPLRA